MAEKTENNIIKSPTDERTQQEITISGNPGKPVGEDGEKMLRRMNESHYAVTGWALEHWKIRENDRILDIGCGGELLFLAGTGAGKHSEIPSVQPNAGRTQGTV